MKSVLILCTGNSCRSQMAQELWKRQAGDGWQVESAGSKPSGYVHPLAIRAMSESGCDLSANRSKSLDEFQNRAFDVVVTVCDNAKEACPAFPEQTTALHWPFPDPADATGTDEEKLVEFRKVRDDIAARIQDYLRR